VENFREKRKKKNERKRDTASGQTGEIRIGRRGNVGQRKRENGEKHDIKNEEGFDWITKGNKAH